MFKAEGCRGYQKVLNRHKKQILKSQRFLIIFVCEPAWCFCSTGEPSRSKPTHTNEKWICPPRNKSMQWGKIIPLGTCAPSHVSSCVKPLTSNYFDLMKSDDFYGNTWRLRCSIMFNEWCSNMFDVSQCLSDLFGAFSNWNLCIYCWHLFNFVNFCWLWFSRAFGND